MKKKIAVLPGDGIGPEVTEQAIKVLDAVAERYGHQFEFCHADVGAVAIDRHGTPLPEVTLEACMNSDSVLFGAIGHPKYDQDPTAKVRPEQGLLQLRKSLGLFANIRPVIAYGKLTHLSPLKESIIDGVDFVIFRELTGGIYFGKKKKEEAPLRATDECTYEEGEIERIARLAFQEATKRKKKVTLIDKANVLETSRLWRQVVSRIASEFEEVELNCMYVDNAAMQVIQEPRQFDVVLTENMFGDIISDEASVIPGSMGLLPSASIGEKNSLFEPIHGSYPQAAGENIANPMAAILSAAMMLDFFGLREESDTIRSAINFILDKGIGTPDLKPTLITGCSHLGDMVAHMVSEGEKLHIKEDKINQRISTII
ncbi:MAG: 3-isopropylmalate dehydrogenase [Saprospiraceae bacterium]|nr:3-isopropylmalate dehydrogenase [Saprospiraceae bacterium]